MSGNEIDWENPWEASTLLHTNDVQLESGESADYEFDLRCDQGTNYTINSYNSSAVVIEGSSINSSSTGSIKGNDGLEWVINSTYSGGEERISLEFSFNQSQPTVSGLKHFIVNYRGILSEEISQMDIYVYNFSAPGDPWTKISPQSINSSVSFTSMSEIIYLISDYTQIPNNHSVRIKVEAANPTPFVLQIDELVVDYSYSYETYEIRSATQNGLWKVLMNVSIPVDFNDENKLGVIEYPLSQIDRFSALKIQTKLKINTSTPISGYNFTYEIFNTTSGTWIRCDWNQDNTTWDTVQHPDLHGDYQKKNGEGGYRLNYKAFEFSNAYLYDQMYLITRGTHDADPFVEFDYENKTSMADFIDANGEMHLRLNITNSYAPFNLTIDTFGIGAFYWGLFDHEYDPNYIWDYGWASFYDTKLLNVKVLDFVVVNGTGDTHLDVLAVIGEDYPYSTWSARLRLFDIKSDQVFTKWSPTPTYVPYLYPRVLPVNNSFNNWILSGKYSFGSTYNFSHKLIKDPQWTYKMTNLDNFSNSKTIIDYEWVRSPNIPVLSSKYSNFYEILGKSIISKDGKVGIILGDYDINGDLTQIRIVDVNTNSTVSIIPWESLAVLGSPGDVFSSLHVDFSSEGVGHKLAISHDDFNDDGYLDHVGVYDIIKANFHNDEIRIYNGNSGNSTPIVLFNTSVPTLWKEVDTKLKMPFTSIGDVNGDGIADGILGVQADLLREGYKGAYLSFYDIFSSSENNAMELTGKKWEIVPFRWLRPYYLYDELFALIENIGDVNGDNKDDVLVERHSFKKTRNAEGVEIYARIPTTEILDVSNQIILFRFNIEIDTLSPISDLNGDGKKELLIASGELLFSVNSRFEVQISHPTAGQVMGSNRFSIEWDTDADYDYFEIYVNDTSHGSTTSKSYFVSLGAGWFRIDLYMFDKNGLVTALKTINIFVPSNYTYYIVTFILIGALIGLSILFKRIRKKQKAVVLIVKKVEEGEKNR
jgi:hypothetical protein